MSGAIPDSIRELAAGYALGALTPEEARAFEAALAQSAELRGQIAEYREVNALLAVGQSRADGPAAAVKARLMDRISREKVTPLESRPRRVNPLLLTALAATTLLAAGLALRNRTLTEVIEQRGALLADRDSTLASVQRQLDRRERTLNTLLTGEDSLTVFQLTATGNQPPGIQFFWNRRSNIGVIHAFRLPPPEQGKVYQLWLIKDGKPLPSATFVSESDGHALVDNIPIPVDGGIEAAAITVEPQGGSTTPTMPIVLVGKVAGL